MPKAEMDSNATFIPDDFRVTQVPAWPADLLSRG